MQINYSSVLDVLIRDNSVKRAVKYVSPTLIIRATRTGKRPARKTDNIEITLTIGRPNYIEREFIKMCKQAKEPFPVKKVQLKLFNNKKKNGKNI